MGLISCPRLSTPHLLFFCISQLSTWQTLTVSFPVETIISLPPSSWVLARRSVPFSSNPVTTTPGRSSLPKFLGFHQPRFVSRSRQLCLSSLLPRFHHTQFHFQVLPDKMFPIGYHITLAHDHPFGPGPVNQVGDRVQVVEPSIEPTQWTVQSKGGNVYMYVHYSTKLFLSHHVRPSIRVRRGGQFWNPSKVTPLPLPPPPLPVRILIR